MHNLPRLLIVVTLLLLGMGWSVEAYLDGMEQPLDHALPQDWKATLAFVSNRDAPAPEDFAARRRSLILSVDPTLEQAVDLQR